MNFELKYFTGTGNSLKVLNTCKDIFTENNHTVSISSIVDCHQISDNTDIIGFSFPVYAFGIPRICKQYLKSLKKFVKPQKVFVIITAGDEDEAGLTFQECETILKNKNCQIVYSEVVQMPINWTVSMNPQNKEDALQIIEAGVKQSKEIALNILNNVYRFHKFNYPKRYSKFGFYKDYYLFKYLGISNLWRSFKTDNSCNGCELCAKICPTQSIKMIEKRPKWTSSCEQCMRCVNFCSRKAIYQSNESETKMRNRYHEPSFNPLKIS